MVETSYQERASQTPTCYNQVSLFSVDELMSTSCMKCFFHLHVKKRSTSLINFNVSRSIWRVKASKSLKSGFSTATCSITASALRASATNRYVFQPLSLNSCHVCAWISRLAPESQTSKRNSCMQEHHRDLQSAALEGFGQDGKIGHIHVPEVQTAGD